MSPRPLIPILVAFMGGIFFGYMGLSQNKVLVFPLFWSIVFLLFSYLFLPHAFRSFIIFGIIFLIGILVVFTTGRHSTLLDIIDEREKAIIEGTVLQSTRIDEDVGRIEVKVEHLFKNGRIIPLNEKIYVSIYNHPKVFSPGERIRFPARLRSFRNFNNPGRYDYAMAMKSKGFTCSASVSDGRRIVPMGKGHLGIPMGPVEMIRRPIRDFFRARLPDQSQAVLRALILGERMEITSKIREPFNITGLGHILVVSGLHIGLIAWLAFRTFKWFLSLSSHVILKTDIRKMAAIMTCFPVVAYTLLAGFQVSSQRAMIMVLAYLFSIILGREREIWSTLALAAIIILALDPLALFSISFQLSFLAVVGILWLAPVLLNKIPNPIDKTRPGTLWARPYLYATGLVTVTVAAVLFLMPITAFYFHRISMVSIPANLTAVPILGFWIIPFGLLSAFFVHIAPPAANLFLQLAAQGLEWMLAIIKFWAHFRWAAFWVVTPNIFEIIMSYGVLAFILFNRKWVWAKIGLYLLLAMLAADVAFWLYQTHFNQQLRVTYLDVGQGNAALIQFPGKQRMLIDGGGFHRGTFDVGRMVVAPALWYLKIHRIDYMVLSHPQSDHMNGLRFIATHFRPKEFWYNGDRVKTPSYKELMNILDVKKVKKVRPIDLADGKEISGVCIEVLHPVTDRKNLSLFNDSSDLNNNSLVLQLSYKGKSFLFPGDLEFPGEAIIVENVGPLLESNILLVPHHGSKHSCSKPFLKMVKPDISIISSGRGNYFGFPHSATMERLKKIGSRIIRIDTVGAVRISVGENRLEIETFTK